MSTTRGSREASAAEKAVSRWITAFNARDAAQLASCSSPEIEVRPINLAGVERVYRGSRALQRWLDHLSGRSQPYDVAFSELRDLGDGRVLASGALTFSELGEGARCWCAFRVTGALVTTARMYLGDSRLAEQLGLLD